MNDDPRLPRDLDAERALLGELLLGGEDAITAVSDDLLPKHFDTDQNRHIYETMLELYVRSESVDVLTVAARLDSKGLLNEIGGRLYLAELLGSAASWANAKCHAEIVIARSMERNISEIGYSMVHAVEMGEAAEDPSTTAAKFSQQLDDLTFHTSADREITGADVLQHIENYLEGRAMPRGLSTGLVHLDEITGGLRAGELWLLAGQTSRGKTTLAVQIALHVMMKHGKTAQYFSFEMSEHALKDKLVCTLAGISSDFLRHVEAEAIREQRPITLPESTRGALRKAKHELESCAHLLSLVTDRALTIDQVAARVRAKHRKDKLGLVVIDYAQKVGPTQGKKTREQEVAWISHVASTIALTQDVPVMLLSQVNRQTDARGGVPKLGDIRESGALEQDADVVVFIRQPLLDGVETIEIRGKQISTKNYVELKVDKNRNGRIGIAHATFLTRAQRFSDLDTAHEGEIPF